ncbi:hypothetical protein [Shewanella surugensis]|uniref:RES domain-containing protein n=1 Tax=Shewanella surugensis TaxID=212020 RepID=A0ABT0L8P6_9GAMM|nr:hypothetical protein [Shewanella surugensis]MCL1124069.1 hypothetical protein [Shewanella surugensis]
MYISNIKASQHQNITDINGFKHVGEIAVKGCPYDFMRRGFFRNDIHDFYLFGKTSALTYVISSTLNRFKSSNANNNIGNIYIELIFFSDKQADNRNGTACVSIDLIRKELKVISARDVDNNQIPTVIDQVSGNDFAFSSIIKKDKFDAYIHYMFNVNNDKCQDCIAVDFDKVGDGGIYTYQLHHN